MIARLVDTAANLLVYFCAATLVAELVVLAYLWSAWELDGQKLARIAAVARGIELPATASGDPAADGVAAEEVSYEEIIDRRARLFRDLELRELALKNAVDQLTFQQRELAEQQQKQRQFSQKFAAQLQALKEGAEAEGREVVRSTLQSLQPSQAKQQLVEMLDDDEMDEVVMLLAEMPASNRAKILAEFKTPDENDRLAEVLRRIRQGAPQASLADQAMNQLEAATPILR